MEAGTSAGLALRRAGDEESQFAARKAQENQAEQGREDEAGQRLRQSYDALAQQHDLSRQEIAARTMQAQAADALRQHAQDSLTVWRQQQAQAQQQRLKDQENKLSAAATLRENANKDINAFWSDLPEKGLSQSLIDHPFAAAEPGIRQAAAQKLINPKEAPPEKPLSVKYNLPKSAGTATGPLPLMQKQFGTNLPPELQAPASAAQSLQVAPGDTSYPSLLPAGGTLAPISLPAPAKPAPLPKNKTDLQKDTLYDTPKGQLTWDGENFVTPSQ